MDLDTPKPIRILCAPAFETEAWRDAIAAVFRAFRETDPVALVVRVDGPTPERVNQAVDRLSGLLAQIGIALERTADIVIEASELAPLERQTLLAAVQAFLPTGGAGDGTWTREAEARGLPVLQAGSPEELRRQTDALAGGKKGPALWQDPNRFARPAGLELGTNSVVHGYQEYVFDRKLGPIPREEPLRCKQRLTERFFEPRAMQGKSLLDIGANGGFFSFWAAQNGAREVIALDMDAHYIAILEAVGRHHGLAAVRPTRVNVQDWNQPADLVLAFAMVHWLYSCTATFGSLDAIIERLSQLTRETLIVEWVDPADKAMLEFQHTSFNPDLVRGPYTVEAFEAALRQRFARVERLGHSTPTRVFYAAYRHANEISSCPLPPRGPEERIIASRTLCQLDGVVYHSRVYLGADGLTVEKQTSGTLALHEAALLRSLTGPGFPRVISERAGDGESSIVLERIVGPSVETNPELVAPTPAALAAFFGDCLEILEQLEQAGIEHRDITPRNLLVRDGRPVLIDFGWGRREDQPFVTPPTLGGRGRAPEGPDDLFAMGTLFGELLPVGSKLFAPLIAAMTAPARKARVRDLRELRRLLAGLALPAAWDVPLRFSVPMAPP
jgi:SAM-dependent methyltransferase